MKRNVNLILCASCNGRLNKLMSMCASKSTGIRLAYLPFALSFVSDIISPYTNNKFLAMIASIYFYFTCHNLSMARDVNLKWVDATIAKDKQTCFLCIKKGYHRQKERAKWNKLCWLVTCTLASVRDHEVVKSAITSHTKD